MIWKLEVEIELEPKENLRLNLERRMREGPKPEVPKGRIERYLKDKEEKRVEKASRSARGKDGERG